jgi:hypothetical protein
MKQVNSREKKSQHRMNKRFSFLGACEALVVRCFSLKLETRIDIHAATLR